MDRLRVRAYNVQFGDAVLVSFPDRGPEGDEKVRHLLIDVGNVLFKKKGGADDAFKPVVEDVLKELDDEPLDLYVMTHEHLDHVQGLRYAESKLYVDHDDQFKEKISPRFAWLTKSSQPGYYDEHEDAKRKNLMFQGIYDEIDGYMQALSATGAELSPMAEALWLNNNYRKTQDCVDYIAGISDDPRYVYRGFETEGHHPFEEAKIEIWAPEENTAEYYSNYRPMTMDLGVTPTQEGEAPAITDVDPPPGVYAGAFYNLLNMRRGYMENLLAIDKAANNTSVVFALEWRGVRLLFTGDAEVKSWKMMEGNEVLKPVDFLKISHHASHTGTPDPDLLNKIIPPEEGKMKCGLVSTWEGTYSGVPDGPTLDLLRERCEELHLLHKKTKTGEHLDVFFEPVA
jgi:hypothetical protein